MTEKVKLPKEVCDALDSITTYAEDSEIVHLVFTGACDTWDTQRLSKVTPNTIMRALVIGYEAEMTAEEQIKELYQDTLMMKSASLTSSAIDEGYRMGIRDALRIHGIHYDWLEGDAE